MSCLSQPCLNYWSHLIKNTRFLSNTFISNARLKLAKNQANAKQRSEAESLLLKNYSHSSSMWSFKNDKIFFLLCYIILYYITQYYIILLYYIMLCHIMLYYFMLLYYILIRLILRSMLTLLNTLFFIAVLIHPSVLIFIFIVIHKY